MTTSILHIVPNRDAARTAGYTRGDARHARMRAIPGDLAVWWPSAPFNFLRGARFDLIIVDSETRRGLSEADTKNLDMVLDVFHSTGTVIVEP